MNVEWQRKPLYSNPFYERFVAHAEALIGGFYLLVGPLNSHARFVM